MKPWSFSSELVFDESEEVSLGNSLEVSLGNSLEVSLGNSLEVSLGNSLEVSLGNSLEVSLGNSLEVSLEVLELASLDEVEFVLEELLLPLEGVLESVELEGLDDVSEWSGVDVSDEVGESELVLSVLVLSDEAPSVSELVAPRGRSCIELFC